MSKITYTNKQFVNQNANVPAINKVQDTDMNEIKSVVNGLVSDSYSTDTEAAYSCNYVNTKLQEKIFTLNNSQSISASSISRTGSASNITSDVVIKYNDDKTVVSFSGNINMVTGTTPGNIIFNTDLRPSSTITLAGNILRIISSGVTVSNVGSHTMTIDTSGKVTISYTYVSSGSDKCRLSFISFPVVL